MRPIQWYLKQWWNYMSHGLSHRIMVSRDLNQALQWWSVRENLSQGVPFSLPNTITTDASMEGLGGHCRLSGLTTLSTTVPGLSQNADFT